MFVVAYGTMIVPKHAPRRPKQINGHECLSSVLQKYGNCTGRDLYCVRAKLLQCSLNNVGNMWVGIILQQNDAVRQHSWAFGLDGMLQILQSFHVSPCINCGTGFQKVNEEWALAVKEKGQHDFPGAGVHCFGFFWWGESMCFHCRF